MIVRDASPFDIPNILEMLRSYRSQTPLPFLADVENPEYIIKMLTAFMAGKGLVLVAENDGLAGMLIASISPSAWSEDHYLMSEMAYWVEPECRGGTAGYRLLNEYCKRGKEMKESGRICHFLISKMSNSPDLKYGKFGFEKLEEFWVN
jgi:hypothetical protein